MPVYQLDVDEYWFPSVSEALDEPQGLLAVGGDLSVPRLLLAYQCGIFPWFSDQDPILWWAPSPRMVVVPDHVHVARSMSKFMRKTPLIVTFDHAFERVVIACGKAPRSDQGQAGSWITASMQQAYTELYRGGYAHSVEVWDRGELVGGLYGVAIGCLFFGESMFSLTDNASKMAFIHLAEHLSRWGFLLIDCQMFTSHLASLGAKEVPMLEFQKYLDENLAFGIDSLWGGC